MREGRAVMKWASGSAALFARAVASELNRGQIDDLLARLGAIALFRRKFAAGLGPIRRLDLNRHAYLLQWRFHGADLARPRPALSRLRRAALGEQAGQQGHKCKEQAVHCAGIYAFRLKQSISGEKLFQGSRNSTFVVTLTRRGTALPLESLNIRIGWFSGQFHGQAVDLLRR